MNTLSLIPRFLPVINIIYGYLTEIEGRGNGRGREERKILLQKLVLVFLGICVLRVVLEVVVKVLFFLIGWLLVGLLIWIGWVVWGMVGEGLDV